MEKLELSIFDSVVEMAINSLDLAEQHEVKDKDSAVAAKTLGVELKDIEKTANKIKLELTKPFRDEVTKVNEYAKEILVPLGKAKKILGDKALTWQQAENKRLEEERQAQIKAENERVRLENEERQKEYEAQAEQEDTVPKPVETVVAKPVEIVKKESFVPTQETWDYEIIDITKIDRKYFVLDTIKLRKAIISDKVRVIEGIRIFSTPKAVMK